MRAEGPLVTNYMGRPNRLYIRPMNANHDELWTIVVFRELHPEETMNLETLSLVSIMFFLYAGAIGILLGFAHWMRRGRLSGSWLWPDSRKASKGTIRGDFGHNAMMNVVHGSDSSENAAAELKRFFEPNELFEPVPR